MKENFQFFLDSSSFGTGLFLPWFILQLLHNWILIQYQYLTGKKL